MEKLAFSWNEWTTMCVAVFLTWEFILYYQHICEERLGLPALPNTSSIQNLFIHLWSCFWDLSKRQSRPLFFKWVKAHTWLSSNNFPKGLIFLVSLTSEMTTQNHRKCLVRLHLHFPWLPWDFAVMKTILWCNALWITGDAISVLPVNS